MKNDDTSILGKDDLIKNKEDLDDEPYKGMPAS